MALGRGRCGYSPSEPGIFGAWEDRPRDALQANAFENPAKVAGKPVIKVEISNLSKAKLAFQHFEFSLKRGRPAAQTKLVFG